MCLEARAQQIHCHSAELYQLASVTLHFWSLGLQRFVSMTKRVRERHLQLLWVVTRISYDGHCVWFSSICCLNGHCICFDPVSHVAKAWPATMRHEACHSASSHSTQLAEIACLRHRCHRRARDGAISSRQFLELVSRHPSRVPHQERSP